MNKNNKDTYLDLVSLAFFSYVYLWVLGPWNSIFRLFFTFYFFIISTLFYLFLLKRLNLNHMAALLGAIVFSYSGSDLTLTISSTKIPYPGILSIFISFFVFFNQEKRKKFIYLFTIIAFILSIIFLVLRFPPLIINFSRIIFNFFAGISVAYGFEVIFFLHPRVLTQRHYDKIEKFFRSIWLLILLILLPLGYSLLVTFTGISKDLIPNILNSIVMFEICLGWTIIILNTSESIISSTIPFITILLVAADIFTYWAVYIGYMYP